MIWLFASLAVLFSGANAELYARQHPAKRLVSRKADAFWALLGGFAGLVAVVSFVASFFKLAWWSVPPIYFGAAFAATFIARGYREAGLAPLISQALILVGSVGVTLCLISFFDGSSA